MTIAEKVSYPVKLLMASENCYNKGRYICPISDDTQPVIL
jgi:hypothetical protein